MITRFTGKLNIPEGNDLNRIQYILFDSKNTRSMNLTEEFEIIYNSENNRCGLVIHNVKQEKDIICEVGELFKANGLWYINGVCIDYRIWDLAGETLEVLIDIKLEDEIK